ncbi:helix-turn-helix transcriptional regulator [Citrobacter freundii]|nr:helix-turn-helix transcriptional regulator [Citrobacter freundii]ELK6450117.1 helix-turn-helix transcriptional regulator [Citrobacter freundii]HAU5612286.1 helix-turn-helix transcriptional regulator [Citrobacter freundii]HDP8958005.1 helix-turn-helix transcriptional regulator [Citrobacter freundii]
MNDTTIHNRIFSKRLKEARLTKGLSQKQLGILAGIDEFVASPRINRYEKGVHQANIEIVQRLADVLELPLAYFYAEDDDLASMIRNWNRVDECKRKQVLEIILRDP